MSILADFSTETVDAAVEVNFLSFVDALKQLDGGELYTGDDMIRVVFPDIPHPLMNMVMQTRLEADVDSAIQSAMEVYTERNIPFLWQIEPSTRPADLGEKLLGMQALGEFPVVVADLDAITEASNTPDNFQIRRVSNDELLRAYSKPLKEGFQLPDFVVDPFIQILSLMDLSQESNVQSCVGFLDGEPVSAGSTIYRGGVAGFYNGTVLESVRGKGIGTANVLHRIEAARQRGYRAGFMISAGNAYNLYKRFGFKDYTLSLDAHR